MCFKLLMLVNDLLSDMRSSAVRFISLCSNSSRLCSDSCDHLWMWWSGPTDCCCLSTFSNIWNGTELFLACEQLGWNCNRCHFMHTLISVACFYTSDTHSQKYQSLFDWSWGWGKGKEKHAQGLLLRPNWLKVTCNLVHAAATRVCMSH